MPSPPPQWSSNWQNAWQNAQNAPVSPNPGNVQLHGGSFGFRQPGSVAQPPSSMFGFPQGQQQGQQGGQPNDFMAQLRSFMQQYQQPGQQQGQPGQQGQQGFQFQRTNLPGMNQGRGGPGVAAGDFLSEAIANDYANRVRDQQRMAQGFDGLIQGVQQIPMMGLMGIGQTMQMNQQGADMAREGASRMMDGAKGAQGVAKQARRDVQAALGSAQQGIDTQTAAIEKQDFFRKDVVSGGMAAIGSQLKQMEDRINSDPNLPPEAREAELANVRQQFREQGQRYAAENDQRASENLLAAKSQLANLQMAKGSLGMQGAGITSQVGMQANQMSQQAIQAGYQMMQSQNQFATSAIQSSIANAQMASLQGNMAGMELYSKYPFFVSGAGVVNAMLNAQGLNPGDQVSGRFGDRLGGLIGNQQFRGYADPTTA